MKAICRALLVVMVLALTCAMPAFAEDETTGDERIAQLKQIHEENMIEALRSLARFNSDDAPIGRLSGYFDKYSEIWKWIERLDGGWFSRTNSREFSNERTENWVWISDTCFTVDVYCDYTISFAYKPVVITYPCAMHFKCELVDKNRDRWRITEFSNIPSEADALKAERLTQAHEGISVHALTGATYYGFMMIVDDPSRLIVGTIDSFSKEEPGMRIDELCEKYGAIAGINGGGFSDDGGSGKGGDPYGIVMSQGQLLRKHRPGNDNDNTIVGFNINNELIVNKYLSNDLEPLMLRDAVAFAPALVSDGQFIDNKHTRSNLSTRTAIGQDAQGRVLMLVISGRSPNSMGTNMSELSNIMLEYGAVVACNLDGGTSTAMYLGGESVLSGFPLEVSRNVPAVFLVMP